MNKKKFILICLFIFAMFFLGVSSVGAADVTTKIHFCKYPGTIRTLKIFGLMIILIKIVIPLIIIGSSIFSLFSVVMNGKDDELRGFFGKFVKKIIAGFVIFIAPTIIDYSFDTFIGYDNPEMSACEKCLFDLDYCIIPVKDPDLEIDEES